MADGILNPIHNQLIIRIIQNGKPILFSNWEAFTYWESFVDEECPHIKRQAICTNNITILISQNIILFMVDLEADFVGSAVEEVDFGEFIQLTN